MFLLHLFDQIYNENSNIVKCYVDLKYLFLLHLSWFNDI